MPKTSYMILIEITVIVYNVFCIIIYFVALYINQYNITWFKIRSSIYGMGVILDNIIIFIFNVSEGGTWKEKK